MEAGSLFSCWNAFRWNKSAGNNDLTIDLVRSELGPPFPERPCVTKGSTFACKPNKLQVPLARLLIPSATSTTIFPQNPSSLKNFYDAAPYYLPSLARKTDCVIPSDIDAHLVPHKSPPHAVPRRQNRNRYLPLPPHPPIRPKIHIANKQ